jgi:hypothetical protein
MQFSDGQSFGDRPGPHAAQELRTHAVLDALGMLDANDAAQFDRAFRDAVPSVQAELRRLQAEVAADPSLLSSEEPSADLKARTLARVMTEVEAHEAQLAPIAHIGRAGVRSGRRSVGSIDAQDLMAQAMELATLRTDVDRFGRSSRAWRAAAFALVAGLVAALVFQVSVQGLAARITELALGTATAREINEALDHPGAIATIEGADFRRGLSSPAGANGGTVTLAVDAGANSAFLLTVGLRPGTTYTLVAIDDYGERTEISTFVARSDVWGHVVALGSSGIDPQALRSARLVLVDGAGNEVMSG